MSRVARRADAVMSSGRHLLLAAASGLILMGARPYDPNLGRFVYGGSVDGGSANSYDYV